MHFGSNEGVIRYLDTVDEYLGHQAEGFYMLRNNGTISAIDHSESTTPENFIAPRR